MNVTQKNNALGFFCTFDFMLGSKTGNLKNHCVIHVNLKLNYYDFIDSHSRS